MIIRTTCNSYPRLSQLTENKRKRYEVDKMPAESVRGFEVYLFIYLFIQRLQQKTETIDYNRNNAVIEWF